MLKDEAGPIGFEFPDLEGKTLEYNFSLVGDEMLIIGKNFVIFQCKN